MHLFLTECLFCYIQILKRLRRHSALSVSSQLTHMTQLTPDIRLKEIVYFSNTVTSLRYRGQKIRDCKDTRFTSAKVAYNQKLQRSAPPLDFKAYYALI